MIYQINTYVHMYVWENEEKRKGEVYILFSYANILYFSILYLKLMSVSKCTNLHFTFCTYIILVMSFKLIDKV